MKNIKEILQEQKIELTEEQQTTIEKAVLENYKTVADYDRQVEKLTKAEEKNTAVQVAFDDFKKNYDGVDVEGMKTQITTLETSLSDANSKYDNYVKKDAFDKEAKKIADDFKCVDYELAVSQLPLEELMNSNDRTKDIKAAFENLKTTKALLFEGTDSQVVSNINVNSNLNQTQTSDDAQMRAWMGLNTAKEE